MRREPPLGGKEKTRGCIPCRLEENLLSRAKLFRLYRKAVEEEYGPQDPT